MSSDRPGPSLTVPDRLFVDFQQALAGRYSLERELGRGGMGVVYLAREVRLDRPVAIKLLPPWLAAEPSLRERFLREARTAAKLSHPNIVPIYTVDEIAEYVFYAMAYVDGETLTERVRRRGPVAPSDATRILRDVAWALGYAHAQGVVHRDVKPDNILLEAGTDRALVADFGIAAVVRDATGVDGGAVTGTPEFMSPEQALGEPVDGRSDLYALGVLAYFAISGRLPFQADTATEVLAKQVTEPPRPLVEIADGVPRRLVQLVEQCLAKDREARPADAGAVADRLRAALEQRRELPVPLRVFVKRGARFSAVGSVVYVMMLPVVISIAARLAPSGSRDLAGFAALIGAVTVVPLAVLVTRARRLLSSGFDQQDLGAAFRREIEEGREERAYEFGREATLYERVTRLLAAGALAVASLSGIILASTPWYIARELYGGALGGIFGLSLFSGTTASLMWLNRINRRIDLDTRIWSWLWTGRVGKWLFRLARPFLSARSLPTPATHRATELALGLAAEKLYEQLPRETRSRLRELPAAIRRLEQDAQRMRARLEDLNDVIGTDGPVDAGSPPDELGDRRAAVVADLHAERDAALRRLGDVVAALETIRLNLLKLHAGAASVQTLTTDLGLAREVSAEIDRLLAGQREAEEALGPTAGRPSA
ncbi:MAG TPA: serine/threonine-protein kinase [Gemmatimonadales bacterium]|nr:serine/threonine-protein kinase [Gemmatimonadales bacterium]